MKSTRLYGRLGDRYRRHGGPIGRFIYVVGLYGTAFWAIVAGAAGLSASTMGVGYRDSAYLYFCLSIGLSLPALTGIAVTPRRNCDAVVRSAGFCGRYKISVPAFEQIICQQGLIWFFAIFVDAVALVLGHAPVYAYVAAVRQFPLSSAALVALGGWVPVVRCIPGFPKTRFAEIMLLGGGFAICGVTGFINISTAGRFRGDAVGLLFQPGWLVIAGLEMLAFACAMVLARVLVYGGWRFVFTAPSRSNEAPLG